MSGKNLTQFHFQSEGTCTNGLCQTLDKLGVPRDSKWRALILYMRSIADFDFLSDTQKSKIQALVVEVLQNKKFDEATFKQIVERQERIISEPWHNRLQAALDETATLLKQAQSALGKRKGDLRNLESNTIKIVEQDDDVETIITNIKKGFHDVISLMEQDALNLEHLSQTDELTGLRNRRAFEQRIELEVQKAKNELTPLSLLMLDIDHFKHFNDQHGHLIGDQALNAVGKVLGNFAQTNSQRLGRNLLAARYGGEEFAIILPGTNLEEAAILGEALRSSVEKFNFTIRDPDGKPIVSGIKIAVSVGVAEFSPHWVAALARHLVDAADQALYRAKSQGRNRVCVFQG